MEGRRLVHLAVPGLGGALLLWRAAVASPDVLVDFGREVYFAWRIAEGAVLYADLASFSGPLAPHVNAAWFRLFGEGIRTLAAANALIATLLAWLLYATLTRIAEPRAALAATVVFLGAFAGAELTPVGNYNYLTPYAHDVTHGLVLSVGALYASMRFLESGRLAPFAATSGALGLVVLTRPEVFLAAAPAAVLNVAARAGQRVSGDAGAARLAGAGLVMLAAPAVAFALWFAPAMGLAGAVEAIATPWTIVLSPATRGQLSDLRFYGSVAGTLDWPQSVRLMAASLSVSVAILALPVIVVRMARRQAGPLVAALVFVTTGVVALLLLRAGLWLHVARPLPLVLGFCGLALARRAARTQWRDASTVASLSWLVFALLLLGRILLNTRLHHYGFAYAMPAALTAVVLLLDWLPANLRERRCDPLVLRAAGGGLVAAAVVVALMVSTGNDARRTISVAAGVDRLMADERGTAVQQALDALERRVPRGRTLAVLPEGVMINYLARRVSPVPFVTFMPPELVMFGEPRMVEAFMAAPPDFVAVVHKDTSEYGVRFFGRDYGHQLGRWLADNYRAVDVFGAAPLRGREFGIALLERADP